MPIELHIERLILDGLTASPRERALIRAAVETELTRLLTEGGLADGLSLGGALPSLSAGNIRLDGNGDPGQLGAEIARAVYSGIGKPA